MPSVPQAFLATQLTVYVPTQLPQFTEADVEVVVNEVELFDENFGKTVPEGQIVKPLLSVVQPQLLLFV